MPIVVHCKERSYDVYVGRTREALGWGNPFSHVERSAWGPEYVCATRAEAIEKYERWLLEQPDLVARARTELRGKVLGCWCMPKACHAEVLARVANDWPAPDLSHTVCLDVETDALNSPRTEELGVQPLVCMAYAWADDHASLVDASTAVKLWLEWINDDSLRILLHAGYSDMAALAQAAYRHVEGRDCIPGTGWAYELVFRAYEQGRIIDTEIRQRLTQIAFGPSKGAAQLGAIVSRTFEVDMSADKKIPDAAHELLGAGTPYASWPPEILAATPQRVLYGMLVDSPISSWPEHAREYPKGDVLWPRKIYRYQHDRWEGRPIPDEHRQTMASWHLYLLARPGWRADKARAEHIRTLYQSAKDRCRVRLVHDGVIKQKVVHRGKPQQRVDESINTKRVQELIYAALGDKTPITDKAAEKIGKREPTPAERLAAAERSAGVVRSAIISQGAKLLDIVDAIEVASKCPPVEPSPVPPKVTNTAQVTLDFAPRDVELDDFEDWLTESRSPTLNAYALHTKSATYIKNFLDRLATARRVRTSYETVKDTGRVSSRSMSKRNGINVQQLPRDADKPKEISIRGCVVPDPGWVFIVADYEQLELCALAHILSVMVRRRTGDPTYESSLSKAINAGRDCHLWMAATLLSIEYSEIAAIYERVKEKKERKESLTAEEKVVVEHRQIAKAADFGYPGGQGPETYIEYAAGYNLTLTLQQAIGARDAFMNTWPEMAEYFDIMKQATKKGGGFTTVRQLYSGRLRGGCYFTRGCNCLDDETEALTKDRGWVKGFDLRNGDVILAKNPKTGELRWERAELRHWYDYTGELHTFRTASAELVSTPDHRWLVYNKWHKKDVVKLTHEISNNGDDRIHLTGTTPTRNHEKYGADLCAFIGWYLTDGSKKGQNAIELYQSKRERKAEIRKLLARLNLSYSESKREGEARVFNIHVSDVTKQVRALLPDRVLTLSFLAELSNAELRALYEAMMSGDGSRSKCHSFCAVTEYRRDMFQALCTLLGIATKGRLQRASVGVIATTGQVVHGKPCWIVEIKKRDKLTLSKGQREIRHVQNAKVWCPMVDSTFFVARRKGFVFITGNTLFQGLAADGAKEALGLLINAAYRDSASSLFGTRPSGFVHDEFIVSVRAEQAEVALPEVERLMVQGMRKWIPDVKINAPGKIMTERWSK